VLTLDGSLGEGGGQIVRTALALSLVTGAAFEIVNVRAGRARPGLLPQHLAAVRAAATIGEADVEGDAPGSQRLAFRPRRIRPGEYTFDVGTAGSTGLVLQTVLPPLLGAAGPSSLTLVGGTHNRFAPPFDFLVRAFFPLVRRLGPAVEARLERAGFYPAGGGRVHARVEPASRLAPLSLLERGELVRRRARALVSRLPARIAERELAVVARTLAFRSEETEVEVVEGAQGPGNVVLIELESTHVTEVFSGFGERGLPAETVAERAAAEARAYLEAGAPVGPYLADQLLVPLALAGGVYRTSTPSRHTTTNVDVIRRFLDVRIAIVPAGPATVTVEVSPRR
jgi:RNA 3'-terminal phosphate cyclase (ATP)